MIPPMRKAMLSALALGLFLALIPSRLNGIPVPDHVVASFESPRAFYSTWRIKKWAGQVDLSFLRNDQGPYLQLVCPSSSWAFVKKVDVNIHNTPILTWSWRVKALPKGGDGRFRSSDDEAAQVYVVFPGSGLLGLMPWSSRILGYTWETVPAPGTFYHSPRPADTRIFVLRNERDGLNVWKTESRDVVADFERAFGAPPPNPNYFCIQIDSDDTHSFAESDFGSIEFRSR
jgi:hypothetical protein